MPEYRNDGSSKVIENVKNESGIITPITIEVGKTVKTEYILHNANLTKISDAPFYNPLQANTHVVTATGAEDKEISIHGWTKNISIFNNSSVTVLAYINSKSNTPILYCYSNTERLITAGGRIEKLIFTFSEAATIYVEERK